MQLARPFSRAIVSPALLVLLALAPGATAQTAQPFDCGYRSPAYWMSELRAAIERGEFPDPSQRALPQLPVGNPAPRSQVAGCLSRSDVFAYEDTAGLLLTNFSSGALINLMTQAANALLTTHGDNYDFVGYWVNFTPHHKIGSAFYKFIENDVRGIGDPSTQGTPIFNFRPSLGLAGQNIEGYIMMWNINDGQWQPGSNSGASFTRLALGQEYEHRWAMYLPPLLGGRTLQGDNGACGRQFHWSWAVDGQGSCMEISEWVGSNPAQLTQNFVSFNTDIGGIFSYSDLYLMGYVSPAEMDAGNSELRYMDGSSCGSTHNGTISSFDSSDIIASAGPRVPDHIQAQKHFRSAWIMIHQPGSPPTSFQLDKAVGIMRQHMIDWNTSTVGRGTMDNSLAGTCGGAGVYGCGINPFGSLSIVSGSPDIGTTVTLGVDNPLGTQRSFSRSVLLLSASPDPAFPCGTQVPGLGMAGPGAAGELLISTAGPTPALAGPVWITPGTPAAIPVTIPANQSLIGASVYAQGLLWDTSASAGVPIGLADAVEMRIGT